MPSPAPPAATSAVRWHMLGWVFAAAFIAYLQRTAMSVVAVPLAHDAGFTTSQVGWLFNAFMVTYTLFQVPGGVFGQRVGARRAVLLYTLLSVAALASFALAPGFATGATLFALLIATRLVLGVAHGPLFPTNSGLMQAWFPPRRWALINGLQVMGLSFGGAAAGPLVSAITVHGGWQRAMLATCVPGLLLAAGWWWAVRDTPREHPGVSTDELARIAEGRAAPAAAGFDWRRIGAVLANRVVWVLTLGYLLQNYAYYFFFSWSVTYLVESRHLTLLRSGWFSAVPILAGGVGAWLGGQWCDLAVARLGARRGYRLLPMIALPLAAALLVVLLQTPSDGLAVALLAACFFAIQLTQAPFWAAAFHVSGDQASTATGVLNAGGNLGGIIGIWLIARLVEQSGWTLALETGVGFTLASAATWFWVDADRARRVPA